MNIAGLKTSKFFTLAATVAKLIPIIAFAHVPSSSSKVESDKGNFTPFLQLEPGADIAEGYLKYSYLYLHGFIGFETMSIVAGEMRDPEKNVPRAILGFISIALFSTCSLLAGNHVMLGSRILRRCFCARRFC